MSFDWDKFPDSLKARILEQNPDFAAELKSEQESKQENITNATLLTVTKIHDTFDKYDAVMKELKDAQARLLVAQSELISVHKSVFG